MDAISSYLTTQYQNTASQAAASSASKSVSGISSTSSKEEITDAVKSFESYLVEQVVKEVKDAFIPEDEDEDQTMSMYKDTYMDQAISLVSSEIVDQVGEGITDDFVKSIMLSYGIKDEETTTDDVSSDAQATVATSAVDEK